MSIETVRAAFLGAARPGTRLAQATLRYDGDKQILGFAGWHGDGRPFAFASAPFSKDPVIRAMEIASDLEFAHSGAGQVAPKVEEPKSMATPPINGLAATLREQLRQATARAEAIGNKAKDSVTNLHSVLDNAEATVKQVDAAAADIQAALGLSSNGGPPLDPGK